MVDAAGDTAAILVLAIMNLAFLTLRITIRLRRTERLQISDCILMASFVAILAGSLLVCYFNLKYEVPLLAKRPYLKTVVGDPIIFGVSPKQRIAYQKAVFAEVMLSIAVLWGSKAALLRSYYEMFPKNHVFMRRVLNATTAVVAVTFLAVVFLTGFWCIPASTQWPDNMIGGVCMARADKTVSAVIFTTHLATTLLINLLPLLLLPRVSAPLYRGSIPFALSTLCFGFVSAIVATVSFILLLNHVDDNTGPITTRHTLSVCLTADQNAIFVAACLSIIRLKLSRSPNPRPRAGGGRSVVTLGGGMSQEALGHGGLVIEVERSWTVEVDIVDEWGGQRTEEWEMTAEEDEVGLGSSARVLTGAEGEGDGKRGGGGSILWDDQFHS